MADVPGMDRQSVESWIAAHTDALCPPFEWSLLAGGHSNLTFRINDATGRSAVVRRPPLGNLLPGAHDVAREYRIVAALAPAGVTVAPPLCCCTNETVTGVPF